MGYYFVDILPLFVFARGCYARRLSRSPQNHHHTLSQYVVPEFEQTRPVSNVAVFFSEHSVRFHLEDVCILTLRGKCNFLTCNIWSNLSPRFVSSFFIFSLVHVFFFLVFQFLDKCKFHRYKIFNINDPKVTKETLDKI